MSSDPWVLLSKPVRAPFRDGTSVLVRTLIEGMPPQRRLAYFGDPAVPIRSEGDEVVPAPAFGYQPRLRDKAGLLLRLLDPRRSRCPIHSFFAPNRLSSAVLEVLRHLPPRPVIQTLPASTGAAAVAPLLRRLPRVIVTSDWGRTTLIDAGLSPARVARIYPGVVPPAEPPPDDLQDRRTILFAGDLDAEVTDRLLALTDRLVSTDWRLVVASRPKGPEHHAARARLESARADPERAATLTLLGEVSDFDALLDQAALQVYLASHARRKVDLPLALLEGLARGVPAAVIDAPPVGELARVSQQAGYGAVISLSPDDFGAALDTLMAVLERPPALAAAGADAIELSRARFDVASMAAEYQRHYEALE